MTAQPKGVHLPDELQRHAPLFSAWVASWPEVRRELEVALEAYERHHPAYDPGWVEPIFEMMDTTLHSLSHRAQWLAADLDRGEEPSPAYDDDQFDALLAEAQLT